MPLVLQKRYMTTPMMNRSYASVKKPMLGDEHDLPVLLRDLESSIRERMSLGFIFASAVFPSATRNRTIT
jgi:hypothetical protein